MAVRDEERPHGLAVSAPVSRLPVAMRNLLRRPARSIMTGAAVAISMALLVSMLSVSEGIKESAEAPLLDSREDLVVAPDQGMIEGAHGMADDLTGWDEVDFATPVLYHDVRVMLPPKEPGGPERPKTVEAFGVVPDDFWELMGEEERKRFDPDQWFEHGDDPHFGTGEYDGPFTGEILLSKNLRREGVEPGDQLPALGTNERTFTLNVVGFFDHEFSGVGYIGDLSFAILHLSELQNMTGVAFEQDSQGRRVVDLADGISIALTNEAVREGMEEEVARRIRETWPEHEDDVFTKADQLELIRQETVLAEIFYLAVGSVSMFIGMLFVATIMIVSVIERTREIGMLRAIGISRRTVFTQVLTESMILVLVGALIGIAPGYYGAVWAAGRISQDVGVDIALGFSTAFVSEALFWILLVGLVFAMYPAYVAVRMNIVRAITAAR
ncbi:MAG: ABC transporter permease [Thermoplasmata archaeon]|nr:MAG: ABC transporter permease [Thermoplasmata archaeon]